MDFDPYYKWLGIPLDEQPPHHYRLLGLRVFESDADVIASAADRQMAHVRTHQSGQHAAASQKLLNEIAQARVCLLKSVEKAAYDESLRRQLGTSAAPSWRQGQPPRSADEFRQCLVASGLAMADEAGEWLAALPAVEPKSDAKAVATEFVRAKRLTKYQAQELFAGRTQGLRFGEYVVLDKLGQGGMGHVFRAQHRRMERIVAIKVLAPSAMKRPEAVQRFQREVKTAARLIHPNIVTAYDASEERGMHFLVMELVEGVDLATRLRQQGALPVDEVLSVVEQTARGLAYAHGQGIVHRDIKPGNLLRDGQGIVKILDMGLARLEATRESDELTRDGQVVGTVDFMAPEQALDTRHADARADIYSLGCTMFRLLTNDHVYGGESLMQKLLAHREAPLPSLRDKRPEIAPQLDAFFRRLIAKRPEDRPQSMNDVLAELEMLRTNVRVGAERSSPSFGEVSLSGPSMSVPLAPPLSAVAISPVAPPIATLPVGRPLPRVTDETVGVAVSDTPIVSNRPIVIAVSPTSSTAPSPTNAAARRRRGSSTKPPGLFVWIGGGMALLLLVVLFAVFGGKKKPPSTPESRTSPSVTRSEGNASANTPTLPSLPDFSSNNPPDRTKPRRGRDPAFDDWQPLFDGRSLNGWRGAAAGFAVENGVLVSVGQRGQLYTDAEYGDFRMELEFRMSPGANSGIGLRSPPHTDYSDKDTLEVQLLDDGDPTHWSVGPMQRCGALYGWVAPNEHRPLPAGEWHRLRITYVNTHVQVEINDETLVFVDLEKGGKRQRYGGPQRKRGRIGILAHTGRVEFRDLRVQSVATRK